MTEFFTQRLTVYDHDSRLRYFKQRTLNKTVLHVGCADSPIYNPNHNLHVELCKTNPNVDGFDIQEDVIAQMREHPLIPKDTLYTSFPAKTYDFILCPETIEHVNNVEGFLLGLLACARDDTLILITGPNAFANHNLRPQAENFIEIVHPDHNCWYSPYTLQNVIRKVYTSHGKTCKVHEVGTFEQKTMVYCLFQVRASKA